MYSRGILRSFQPIRRVFSTEKKNVIRMPELVSNLAGSTGMSQVEAKKNLSASMEVIMKALQSGSNVNISGFGTFEIRTRKGGRTVAGLNTLQGQTITIGDSTSVGFKCSNVFKKTLK